MAILIKPDFKAARGMRPDIQTHAVVIRADFETAALLQKDNKSATLRYQKIFTPKELRQLTAISILLQNRAGFRGHAIKELSGAVQFRMTPAQGEAFVIQKSAPDSVVNYIFFRESGPSSYAPIGAPQKDFAGAVMLFRAYFEDQLMRPHVAPQHPEPPGPRTAVG